MASTCEDVSAQMMELLYGELPANARATVDAHVAGCARCRAELEGFERTRAVARRALDEAPPARAHAAIMQAAAAHVAAKAQPAAAARQPAAPARASWWARLRVGWALPTFATVGAVAVFLLANRVFLNPERALGPRPVMQEAPASAPAAAAADQWARTEAAKASNRPIQGGGLDESPRPESAAAPAHRHRAEPLMADVPDEKPTGAAGGGKKAKKEGGRARFAEPPPAKSPAPASDSDRIAPNVFAPPPPPLEGAPAARYKQTDKAARLEEAPAAKASAPSPTARKPAPKPAAAVKGKASLDGLLEGVGDAHAGVGSAGASTRGGVAPRGSEGGYGSGVAIARPAQGQPTPSATANELRRSAPPPASPPAAVAAPSAPPPVAATRPRAKKAGIAESDDEFAPAPEAAMKDEKKIGGGVTGTSGAEKNSANVAILQRADRLFAEGHWAEAAALYRELLRRDPRNESAESWRRRLVAAENADAAEKQTSLAAKRAQRSEKAADAESGTRKSAAKAKAAPAKAAASAPAQ